MNTRERAVYLLSKMPPTAFEYDPAAGQFDIGGEGVNLDDYEDSVWPIPEPINSAEVTQLLESPELTP